MDFMKIRLQFVQHVIYLVKLAVVREKIIALIANLLITGNYYNLTNPVLALLLILMLELQLVQNAIPVVKFVL